MPIYQESKQEREERERKEVEDKKRFYEDKEREREKLIKVAEVEANKEIEVAKISTTPSKIINRQGMWDTIFNAPARFLAVYLSYRLERRNIETPDFLRKFIGG